MKKSLLTMAAALALVSCSQDDLLLSQQDGNLKGAVGVNVFVPTATRGLALNSEDNLIASGNGFDLISYYNAGSDNYASFMGTHADGLEFKHDGSAWDYANRNEVHFWQEVPDGATDLKFFAISPTLGKLPNSGVTADGLTEYNIASDEQSITYTVPTDPAEQVDLMFAQSDVTDFGPTSTPYNNGVPLHFHHALSQIVFKARIADKEALETDESISETVTAHVGSIKLANVYGGGVFDMDGASAILGEQGYLDATGYDNTLWNTAAYTQNAAYTIDALKNNTGINWIAAEELTSGVEDTETAMLLIPQQLSALNLGSLGNSANQKQVDEGSIDLNSGAYLEVSCRIEFKRADEDVVVIVGDKNVTDASVDGYYAKLYIPLNTNWNPGYKYVYTLVFSADSGDPVKAEVVSVDEWNTATNIELPDNGENEESVEQIVDIEGLRYSVTNQLFYIDDAEDLTKMATLVNKTYDEESYYLDPADNTKKPFTKATYAQTDTIDFTGITPVETKMEGGSSGLSNFTQIGSSSTSSFFQGVYHGQGHEIKGLKFNMIENNDPYNVALFYNIQNAVIDNLTVSGNIESYICTAGIVAEDKGNSTISNCISNVNITSTNYIAGGIIGISNNTTITECVNNGEICGKGSGRCGGIVGLVSGTSSNTTISACVNNGKITADSEVGGIVGDDLGNAKIYACYNTGDVDVLSPAGYNGGGGIIGVTIHTQVVGCYNIGAITKNGASYEQSSFTILGGILGVIDIENNTPTASVTSCYWGGKCVSSNDYGTSGWAVLDEVMNTMNTALKKTNCDYRFEPNEDSTLLVPVLIN